MHDTPQNIRYIKFSCSENAELKEILLQTKYNPYLSYWLFKKEINDKIQDRIFPQWFLDICQNISNDIANNVTVHYLRNCPIDDNLPYLDVHDPRIDKLRRKNTFVAEAFLEIFSQLRQTPVFAYETRNCGDFFQDVYPWTRFKHTNTVRSIGEISWHNDRTAHEIRASYLYLLGMHIPNDNIFITHYVSASDIIHQLSDPEIAILRDKLYFTEYDSISKEFNNKHDYSEQHAIFEIDGSIRFYEGNTKPLSHAPSLAQDALLTLSQAISKTPKVSITIEQAGMLCIPNKMGLHKRELVQTSQKNRWLLKTYNFGSISESNKYSNLFKNAQDCLIQEVFP